MVVPVTLVSLRRWENPEDMDIHEVSGCVPALTVLGGNYEPFEKVKSVKAALRQINRALQGSIYKIKVLVFGLAQATFTCIYKNESMFSKLSLFTRFCFLKNVHKPA